MHCHFLSKTKPLPYSCCCLFKVIIAALVPPKNNHLYFTKFSIFYAHSTEANIQLLGGLGEGVVINVFFLPSNPARSNFFSLLAFFASFFASTLLCKLVLLLACFASWPSFCFPKRSFHAFDFFSFNFLSFFMLFRSNLGSSNTFSP